MKVITYKMNGESEYQKIYTGIENVSEGWIVTTCGNPVCAEDVESDNPDYYDMILSLIDGDDSSCEFYECLEAEDKDYECIQEVLGAWGIL